MAKRGKSTANDSENEQGECLELPEYVTVKHPHAYLDDDGGLHSWGEGQVVTGPDQIADLIARQVPLKE